MRSVIWPRTAGDLAVRLTAVAAHLFGGLVRLGDPVNPYAHSWLLMDRPSRANDNAEALLRHLVAGSSAPRVLFALRPDSADWTRLSADGLRRHLVPYGSLRWRLALASAAVQASSVPVGRRAWSRRGCVLVYLRHGVTVTDHSRYLNCFDLDLVLSALPVEHAFLSDRAGPYACRDRVRLTGLPRFDRLHRLASVQPEQPRRLIVIAPTWRKWLAAGSGETAGARAADSSFVRSWSAVLESPVLRTAVASHGYRLVLVPHPLVHHLFAGRDFGTPVEVASYADTDVQALLAQAAMFLTDYSSVAFDAAYAGADVVYYELDRDRFLGGAHTGGPGYWSAKAMGFGPVVETHDDLERELAKWLRRGGRSPQRYSRRVEAAFPHRDGRCSERVEDEIRALLSPGAARVSRLSPPANRPEQRRTSASAGRSGPAA